MRTFRAYRSEPAIVSVCEISRNMSSKSKQKANKNKKETAAETSKKTQEPAAVTVDKSNNILINVVAKPGAKQNSITDVSQEGVGIQINAPAMEGEANTELVKYLSSVLGVKKNDLSLERGHKSRQKVVKLTSNTLTPEKIIDLIRKEIDS